MSSSSSSSVLFELVLSSKKGLSTAEHIHSQSTLTVDTLAALSLALTQSHAKYEWITLKIKSQDEVITHLASTLEADNNLTFSKSKSVEANERETLDSLAAILATLSSTVVPSPIHHSAADEEEKESSHPLFGSQHSSSPSASSSSSSSSSPLSSADEGDNDDDPERARRQALKGKGKATDKDNKTLEDFIDIDGVNQTKADIESSKESLQDILNTLQSLPSQVLDSLPPHPPPPTLSPTFQQDIQHINSKRAEIQASINEQLDGLRNHWEQLSEALRVEQQAGIDGASGIDEEEMEVLIADSHQLEPILEELEASLLDLTDFSHHLQGAMADAESDLAALNIHVARLEEVGHVLDEITTIHTTNTTAANEIIDTLLSDLSTLSAYMTYFSSYTHSYDHLLLEMNRRARRRHTELEAIRDFWAGITAAREDELRAREQWVEEHLGSLPGDLCPGFAEEEPAVWEVGVVGPDETVRKVSKGLLNEAKRRIEQRIKKGQGPDQSS